MKKIATKNELIEMLKNMRALEIVARDSYLKDCNIFEDEEIVKTIKLIKLDEDKHIKLFDYLISFLEG